MVGILMGRAKLARGDSPPPLKIPESSAVFMLHKLEGEVEEIVLRINYAD